MSDRVDPAPRRPLTRRDRWIAVGLAAAFTLLVIVDLAQTSSVAVATVALILVAWIPLLVLHEAGHALAAYAVGWHVHRLVVGFGRDVVRFRIRRMRVIIRRFPATGFVEPVPTSLKWPRLKNAFVYFAGPGIELLAIGLLAVAVGPERYFERANEIGLLSLQCVGAAAGIGAASNLIPFRTPSGSPSDGLGILLSAAIPQEFFEDRRATSWLEDARGFLERGKPEAAMAKIDDGLSVFRDNVPLRAERAVCLAALGKREEAVEALNDVGDPNDHPPMRRALLWHARGRIALELDGGDPALLRDGHLACEAALELAPAYGPIEVTLGAILVERNRIDEALATLRRARSDVDEYDEARALAYLVIAAHRSQEYEEARHYLVELQGRNVNPRLMKRVTDALGTS